MFLKSVLALAMVVLLSIPVGAQTEIEFAAWSENHNEFVQDFNRLNPDINVKIQTSSFREHHEKSLIRLATGDPPDVMVISFAMWMDFAQTGTLLPLDTFVARDEDELKIDDLFSSVVENGRYAGEQLAFDLKGDARLVYANLDEFSKAGFSPPSGDWDWQEFGDTARSLTRMTSDASGPDVWGLNQVDHWSIWSNLGVTRGAPFWTNDTTRVDYSTDGHREVFRYLDGLVEDSAAPVKSVSFIDGESALYFGTVPYSSKMADRATFDWFVYPSPKGETGQVMMAGDPLIAIAKDTPHPEAAWRLVKYLLSSEAQTRIGNMGRGIPVRRSSVAQLENPVVRVFALNMDRGYRVIDRAWSTFNGAITGAVRAVINKEKTIPAALQDAETAMNSALEAYDKKE